MIFKVAGWAALVILAAPVAWADGNSGTPNAELKIGAVRTFSSESQARMACGKDPVVWADRYAGYFYFPKEKEYRKTAEGAFACYHSAVKGNYWGTSPISGIVKGHGAGRAFPYRPLPERPFLGS